MDHQGKEFGVDLYQLEKVAKVDFPAISAEYGEAIGGCERVLAGVAQSMRRPDRFGGDALGPVYRAYLGLHDAVETLLKETKSNLDDTATALGKVAQLYAGTDQAARDELNRRARTDPELDGSR
ncbi:hypothetical protein G3I59_11175 [Amycolatopsis rubida]|uniref:Excreted virulence factor EspC, type VII ESX diderm n=1 Tax=Amycolatopsis rubida TaxID=112413 RepID=A0A1I5NYW8_9PSEU|nr:MULTISPECIES: hypothetical protein [Amycolatopsis]MYW91152.1 hypothetical protein [Amycolatopsis rubida]NEC56137.1 hypothetical protein [Amycolatopsis rubida]OAP21001.1 hypothetical protein A4R44_08210 [Amycolatopsis sp. M39]SFP27002.1 hypothetical protein SAMN05421854_104578 [Amycolatopsis rubida]